MIYPAVRLHLTANDLRMTMTLADNTRLPQEQKTARPRARTTSLSLLCSQLGKTQERDQCSGAKIHVFAC